MTNLHMTLSLKLGLKHACYRWLDKINI